MTRPGGGSEVRDYAAPTPALAKAQQFTKESYYQLVGLAIVRAAGQKGVSAKNAMFIIAQVIVEQGITDPTTSTRKFRIFDVRVCRRRGGEKQRVERESWFKVYPTLAAGIADYFSALESIYSAAAVLRDGKGMALTFGRALKSANYATAPDYAEKISPVHRQVVRDFDLVISQLAEDKEAEPDAVLADAQKANDDLEKGRGANGTTLIENANLVNGLVHGSPRGAQRRAGISPGNAGQRDGEIMSDRCP